MAAAFVTMRADWSVPPARTPRRLTAATATSVATATAPSGATTPVSTFRYRANVIATAACPPLPVTRRSVQP